MPRGFGFGRFKSAAEKFFSPGLSEPEQPQEVESAPVTQNLPPLSAAPPFIPYAQTPFPEQSPQEGQLAIDVHHTPCDLVVTAPIAGVRLEDIEVTIVEDMLTIRGKRAKEGNVTPEALLVNECFWGDFARSYPLPFPVVAEESAAQIKDGILTIKIPKANAVKTKIIKVRSV